MRAQTAASATLTLTLTYPLASTSDLALPTALPANVTTAVKTAGLWLRLRQLQSKSGMAANMLRLRRMAMQFGGGGVWIPVFLCQLTALNFNLLLTVQWLHGLACTHARY